MPRFKRNYRRRYPPRRKRYGRRSYRRRYAGRKRLRRQMVNTASKKYRDTLVSRVSSDGSANSLAPIYTGLNVFGFCPTFRDRSYLTTNVEISRHSANVFYKGYKEIVSIRVTQPVTWRRIVFWTYDTWYSLVPYRIAQATQPDPDVTETYYARRADHKDFYGSDSGLREMMFRGSLGQDYNAATIQFTPMDRKRNKVVYDKSININPNYDAPTDEMGRIVQRKLWHAANRTIWYDDVEQGSSVTSQSGWSSPSPISAGNMMVVDIITNGDPVPADTTTQIGSFGTQGVEYWHES